MAIRGKLSIPLYIRMRSMGNIEACPSKKRLKPGAIINAKAIGKPTTIKIRSSQKNVKDMRFYRINVIFPSSYRRI
jgi:hypothetical protein